MTRSDTAAASAGREVRHETPEGATRLWLIRHGPTHCRTMLGWSDLPADLSDTDALHRLAARLPPDAPVISSDLGRAVATADALQGGRPRLPHDPDLREINFGDWELRGADEIEQLAPDHIRAFWETPGAVCAPGGESWDDLRRRVDRATDRLTQAAPGGGRDVIVVAHLGAILTQVQRARGITAYQALGQKIDNLSLTRLVRGPTFGGGWRAELVNLRP